MSHLSRHLTVFLRVKPYNQMKWCNYVSTHGTAVRSSAENAKFYLTRCDILHVTHLHFWIFNNVSIKFTKISDRYLKIVKYVQ